jgi:hypothetical protein
MEGVRNLQHTFFTFQGSPVWDFLPWNQISQTQFVVISSRLALAASCQISPTKLKLSRKKRIYDIIFYGFQAAADAFCYLALNTNLADHKIWWPALLVQKQVNLWYM